VAYARGVRRMKRRRWPVWRTGVFFLGIATLLLALVPALEAIAADLFSVHMLQHVLLTMIAPPLLFIGEPVRPLLLGLPDVLRARVVRPAGRERLGSRTRPRPAHPLVAVVLFVGGVYLWHWPPLYDGAVEDARIHVLEHAHFFGAAMLFWSVVIDPLPFRGTLPYAARIIYLLLAGAAQNTLLGGILSFSTRLLYPHYADRTLRYGLDALTDQRIGGALMWVVGRRGVPTRRVSRVLPLARVRGGNAASPRARYAAVVIRLSLALLLASP
jgi:cytochrome c oxidase assembly factor CtaG